MSYTHHGLAHVILSASPFSILRDDTLNEAIRVSLTPVTPGVVCLELPAPLVAPQRVRYVWMLLPSGIALSGHVLQDERLPDGSGWLTFEVNETDMGLHARVGRIPPRRAL